MKDPSASLGLTEGSPVVGRLMRPLLCHLSYAAENGVDSKKRFVIIRPSNL